MKGKPKRQGFFGSGSNAGNDSSLKNHVEQVVIQITQELKSAKNQSEREKKLAQLKQLINEGKYFDSVSSRDIASRMVDNLEGKTSEEDLVNYLITANE